MEQENKINKKKKTLTKPDTVGGQRTWRLFCVLGFEFWEKVEQCGCSLSRKHYCLPLMCHCCTGPARYCAAHVCFLPPAPALLCSQRTTSHPFIFRVRIHLRLFFFFFRWFSLHSAREQLGEIAVLTCSTY